jgi:hypothetical protein
VCKGRVLGLDLVGCQCDGWAEELEVPECSYWCVVLSLDKVILGSNRYIYNCLTICSFTAGYR